MRNILKMKKLFWGALKKYSKCPSVAKGSNLIFFINAWFFPRLYVAILKAWETFGWGVLLCKWLARYHYNISNAVLPSTLSYKVLVPLRYRESSFISQFIQLNNLLADWMLVIVCNYPFMCIYVISVDVGIVSNGSCTYAYIISSSM